MFAYTCMFMNACSNICAVCMCVFMEQMGILIFHDIIVEIGVHLIGVVFFFPTHVSQEFNQVIKFGNKCHYPL